MKALTLKQPWAWALANGLMPIINQHEDASTGSRYTYLGIYAHDSPPASRDILRLEKRIGIDALPESYAAGALVGVCKIDRVLYGSIDLPLWFRQWRDEDYPYTWIVKTAVAIPNIECAGRPAGLWTPTSEIQDVVLELYRKEISSRLIARLRNSRKEKGITQVYVAKMLGYTSRHIINIENRGTEAIEKMAMLLDVLDITIPERQNWEAHSAWGE